jgi:hypothetical protein
MEDLALFQTLFILGAVGLTVALVINALFDVLIGDPEWRGWGPFD